MKTSLMEVAVQLNLCISHTIYKNYFMILKNGKAIDDVVKW
jgi:hypothetical protein